MVSVIAVAAMRKIVVVISMLVCGDWGLYFLRREAVLLFWIWIEKNK